MKVYRAYMLIDDFGSYRDFYRSEWYVSKKLVNEFIKKVKSIWVKDEFWHEIEIKEMEILEIIPDNIIAEDYQAYHEFDSE